MLKNVLAGLLVVLVAMDLSAAEPPATAPAGGGFDGSLRLVMYGPIFYEKLEPARRRNLIIETEAEKGRWDRLYITGLSHNNGDHYGFVQDATVDGDWLTIRVLVTIGRDPWIPGGDGSYTLKLKRNGDTLDGTYAGAYQNQPVDGKVTGVVGPARPSRVRDYRPLDPTERPRLLFRKHQLPALKEKLQTPLGQAYLAATKAAAASGDLVALGMLYQLIGDKASAEKAQQIITGYNHNLSPEGGAGSGGIGHQLVSIALAYDLCYEAFDKDFRATLAEDFDREVSFMQRSLAVAGANFHPCSNFFGPGRGAPAIASLALFGEKGPPPRKPVSPDEILAKGDMQAKLMAKTGQIEKYKAEYARLLARWEADQLAWERTGGADLGKLSMFHAGFTQVNRHYRYGIGDGGYGSETGAYADIAAWYPLLYNTYYMNMFGKEASCRPDVRMLPVRRMMQTLFLPGNKIAHETIGAAGGWRTDFVTAGFPAVPDEFKPGLLWGWNHVCGVKSEDPSTMANAFKQDWIGSGGLKLAHAFIHYPLDMKPVHPQQSMPKNWEASGFGWYCFRSGWDKGHDDILAQVFLKAMPIGGWNLPNAGTFKLMGLGRSWVGNAHSKEAYRFEEPVLLLPDDKVNDRNCGHLLTREFRDGSGTLSIDMNDLYGTTEEVENQRRKPDQIVAGGVTVSRGKPAEDGPDLVHSRLYDRNNIREAENWRDSGLTGLRAFGFDYSGKSGSPLLMVIVDKVKGGGKRDWNWPKPSDKSKQGKVEEPKVAADERSFTLDYGDANLKVTFVSPQAVKIDPAAKVRIDYKRWSGKFVEYDRVSATSDGGSFFAIITLQRKAAPAVSVEGSGLDAKVKVGGQTVRFDGQNVVFGS